jgi:hypothetical protein
MSTRSDRVLDLTELRVGVRIATKRPVGVGILISKSVTRPPDEIFVTEDDFDPLDIITSHTWEKETYRNVTPSGAGVSAAAAPAAAPNSTQYTVWSVDEEGRLLMAMSLDTHMERHPRHPDTKSILKVPSIFSTSPGTLAYVFDSSRGLAGAVSPKIIPRTATRSSLRRSPVPDTRPQACRGGVDPALCPSSPTQSIPLSPSTDAGRLRRERSIEASLASRISKMVSERDVVRPGNGKFRIRTHRSVTGVDHVRMMLANLKCVIVSVASISRDSRRDQLAITMRDWSADVESAEGGAVSIRSEPVTIRYHGALYRVQGLIAGAVPQLDIVISSVVDRKIPLSRYPESPRTRGPAATK